MRKLYAFGAYPFVFAALLHAQPAASQTPSASPTAPERQPSFEVTSVKRDTTDAMVQMGGPDISRFVARNVTAKDLIQFAYDVRDFQFSGGPNWITTEKFDADGKVEDSLAEQIGKLPHEQQQDELRLLVQSLLADRYKLQVRHETKELPIYSLVVAKNGPKLKAVDAPDPQATAPFRGLSSPGSGPAVPPGEVLLSLGINGKGSLTGKAASIPNLARMLSLQVGRHVEDDTNLKGSYDFLLSYSQEGLNGPMRGVPDDAMQNSNAPSLFTAIQEQLGLKLESTKGPVDTIVVEHIEEPAPN